jgi:ABC-type branched-subunit amino acid transport system ATPase component
LKRPPPDFFAVSSLPALIARGLSVLLIEQNAPLSLSIADRAYILDDGKVVYSGKAADLAQDTELVNKLAGADGKSASVASPPRH